MINIRIPDTLFTFPLFLIFKTGPSQNPSKAKKED